MSIQPRTVDNLGSDVSERYAIDQATYDSLFQTDTNAVAQRAQILEAKPFTRAEPFFLLDLSPRKPFAHFFPPMKEELSTLFTTQLLPALFPSDSLDPVALLEEKLSSSSEDQKKQAILDFIKCCAPLIKDLHHIYGQISRFQRG